MRIRVATLLVLLWLSGIVGFRPLVLGNEVTEWNGIMIDAIRTDNSGPTLSSRNLAILHTSIYDAVNSIFRTHQLYRFAVDPPSRISVEATVVGTGYEVVRILYPGASARAENRLRDFMSRTPSNESVTNGVEFGRRIAQMMLDSRVADGVNTEVPYIPSTEPGQWARTPPLFRPPLAPNWRYVDPFSIPEVEPFLPPGPPSLDSPEYAAALNEVKVIGAKDGSARTQQQSETAIFWSDFSYTSMPPGHWHLIAAGIVREKNTPLAEAARLFALLSVAQADAAIVCWEAKYRWNFWRPVTALQRADEDGNDATAAVPAWDHFLPAPPFPSYPSGHSTFSKASAEVLTFFNRSDAINFTVTSDAIPGLVRSYSSLAACADEIGISRIYGGIHFSFDNLHGKESGRKIARYVTDNWLLPNDRLPALRVEGTRNGTASVRVHARIGRTFVLEGSNELKNWRELATGSAIPGGTLIQVKQSPANQCYFFRVMQ